jgi:hypothetical protein
MIMGDIKESDWKHFSKIKPTLLNRYCEKVLAELQAACGDSGTAHERYLKIWKLLKKRDRVLADCFDDWRRSSIFPKIMVMRRNGLLEPQDMEGVSEETKALIKRIESLND